MNVSDLVFGLLLLALFSWTMIIALQQNNLGVVVNNLSARQQAIISDEKYCEEVQGFQLVKQENIRFSNYAVIPKVSETKQLVLCVYQQVPT